MSVVCKIAIHMGIYYTHRLLYKLLVGKSKIISFFGDPFAGLLLLKKKVSGKGFVGVI